MPLKKSTSKKAFESNVKELVSANKDKPSDKKRPMNQIIAIAYSVQKKAKKS